jgi:arylsulfatase A-like enzyme
VGVTVLFLPTYSLDLNPMEYSWAHMKKWLRDSVSHLCSVYFAIMEYFDVLGHVINQLFDGFTHISDFAR